LRHAVPSFTVEVRRRPRLVTSPSQQLQSSKSKTPPTAFRSDSYRLAAAAFGTTKTPDQPFIKDEASPPKRRILPSLIPEPSPDGQHRDALLFAAGSDAVSRVRKPPAVRPMKGRDPESKLSRNLELSPEQMTQEVDRSSVRSVRASLSPSDESAVSQVPPKATPTEPVGNVAGPSPKAKRRVQPRSAFDVSSFPVAATNRRSITRTDSSGALLTVVDNDSRPDRKRTIMGRYVFGDGLKPGERWKRRLSKGHEARNPD
jgi:hypothetical protein